MKDNELLIEYLGLKYYIHAPTGDIVKGTAYAGSPEFIWCPDKSWDDLMMVVKKIEKEQQGWVTVKIYDDHCSIEAGESVLVPVNWQIKDKHEAVYSACVTYIQSIK